MTLTDIIRLVTDSGLFVLIWIVQLVVYPGFNHYDRAQLRRWHPIYTKRITFIVFPLMTAQLVTGGIQMFSDMTIYTVLSLILITATWLVTFIEFVPMHGRLESVENPGPITQKMVSRNWSRTILWSALFVLTLSRSLELI